MVLAIQAVTIFVIVSSAMIVQLHLLAEGNKNMVCEGIPKNKRTALYMVGVVFAIVNSAALSVVLLEKVS